MDFDPPDISPGQACASPPTMTSIRSSWHVCAAAQKALDEMSVHTAVHGLGLDVDQANQLQGYIACCLSMESRQDTFSNERLIVEFFRQRWAGLACLNEAPLVWLNQAVSQCVKFVREDGLLAQVARQLAPLGNASQNGPVNVRNTGRASKRLKLATSPENTTTKTQQGEQVSGTLPQFEPRSDITLVERPKTPPHVTGGTDSIPSQASAVTVTQGEVSGVREILESETPREESPDMFVTPEKSGPSSDPPQGVDDTRNPPKVSIGEDICMMDLDEPERQDPGQKKSVDVDAWPRYTDALLLSAMAETKSHPPSARGVQPEKEKRRLIVMKTSALATKKSLTEIRKHVPDFSKNEKPVKWEAEKILQAKWDGDAWEFEVKWKGHSQTSWETRNTPAIPDEVINEYLQMHQAKKALEQQRKPDAPRPMDAKVSSTTTFNDTGSSSAGGNNGPSKSTTKENAHPKLPARVDSIRSFSKEHNISNPKKRSRSMSHERTAELSRTTQEVKPKLATQSTASTSTSSDRRPSLLSTTRTSTTATKPSVAAAVEVIELASIASEQSRQQPQKGRPEKKLPASLAKPPVRPTSSSINTGRHHQPSEKHKERNAQEGFHKKQRAVSVERKRSRSKSQTRLSDPTLHLGGSRSNMTSTTSINLKKDGTVNVVNNRPLLGVSGLAHKRKSVPSGAPAPRPVPSAASVHSSGTNSGARTLTIGPKAAMPALKPAAEDSPLAAGRPNFSITMPGRMPPSRSPSRRPPSRSPSPKKATTTRQSSLDQGTGGPFVRDAAILARQLTKESRDRPNPFESTSSNDDVATGPKQPGQTNDRSDKAAEEWPQKPQKPTQPSQPTRSLSPSPVEITSRVQPEDDVFTRPPSRPGFAPIPRMDYPSWATKPTSGSSNESLDDLLHSLKAHNQPNAMSPQADEPVGTSSRRLNLGLPRKPPSPVERNRNEIMNSGFSSSWSARDPPPAFNLGTSDGERMNGRQGATQRD